MGSFFSIFKSKKKHKHRISSNINSIENPSAARERRHERRGSVQEPMKYYRYPNPDDEPQIVLYEVPSSQSMRRRRQKISSQSMTRRRQKIPSRSAPSRSIPSRSIPSRSVQRRSVQRRSVQRRWYGGNHTRKQNRAYK